MTPEEKRLKVIAPIPLEKVLLMYGVNSESELINLLKGKFDTYSRNFLQNQAKKSINIKIILLIIFTLLIGLYFMFYEDFIRLLN